MKISSCCVVRTLLSTSDNDKWLEVNEVFQSYLLYELRQLRPYPFRQGDCRLSRRRSRHKGLANLFDRQATGGKRSEQLGFRPGEIEPGKPVRAIENDHLPIVNGRNVGTGLGCQQCEDVP